MMSYHQLGRNAGQQHRREPLIEGVIHEGRWCGWSCPCAETRVAVMVGGRGDVGRLDQDRGVGILRTVLTGFLLYR